MARASNWELGEKHVLVELAGERIDAVECKRTDIKSNYRKAIAWDEVMHSYSAKYGNKRPLPELKQQWKRLKGGAKKEDAAFRRESRKTGGGPPPPSLSPLTVILKDLCPREFIQIRNPFDDDSQLDTEAVTVLDFLAGSSRDCHIVDHDDEDK